MGPAAGYAIDTHGPRKTATAGLAVGAVGFFVMSTATTLTRLYTAYAITGIGFPMVTMCGGKIIAAWFVEKRGRMMGIVGAGNNFGGCSPRH